jgi:predicted phage terminase large subunit-like protein
LPGFVQVPERSGSSEAYISVDAAASTAETADYTAISVVLAAKGKFVVIRAERGRWEYEALRSRVEHWLKYLGERLGRPITLLIEAASAGVSLCPPMQRLAVSTGKFRCFYYKPVVGKDTRVLLSIPAFVEKRVYLQDAPGKNDWIETYINEFLAYPKGRFDDQVDSLTQLISHLMPRILADERPLLN